MESDVLKELLTYLNNSIAEAEKDYEGMCDDGDDTGMCGAFLFIIEQHTRFAKALNRLLVNKERRC